MKTKTAKTALIGTVGKVQCDPEVPGLRFRFDRDRTVALLRLRVNGRDTTLTIGELAQDIVTANTKPDALTPEQARELAREAKASNDPYAVLDAKRKHLRRGEPTLGDLWALFKETDMPALRPATRKAYEIWAEKHILPFFGETRALASITPADVKRFRESYRGGNETSGNMAIRLLARLFSLAIRDQKWLSENPCIGVEKFAERKREAAYKGDDAKRLLEALDDLRERRPIAAFAIAFIALTGARRSEVMRARWTDFDVDAGLWHKRAEAVKGKRSQTVPLMPEARSLLTTWREHDKRPDSEWVFPSPIDARHPIRDLNGPWAEVRDAAGLDGWKLHSLRHAFATSLIGHLSLTEVGYLLGHSDLRHTQRYSHPQADRIGERLAGIPNLLTAA